MTQVEKDKKLFQLLERFVEAHESIASTFRTLRPDQDIALLADALSGCASEIASSLETALARK